MNKVQIIEDGFYIIGNEKLNKYLTLGKYVNSPLEFTDLDEELRITDDEDTYTSFELTVDTNVTPIYVE